MDEVVRKYPLANAVTIQEAWRRFQYTDQKSYKSFLQFYEETLKIPTNE